MINEKEGKMGERKRKKDYICYIDNGARGGEGFAIYTPLLYGVMLMCCSSLSVAHFM